MKILSFGVSLNTVTDISTLIVTSMEGTTESVQSDSPAYQEALQAVTGGCGFDELRALIESHVPVELYATDRITVFNGHVKVDGDEVDNSITRFITDRVAAGEPFGQVVAFYDLLLDNPSYNSRRQLFDWLATNTSVKIDDDGFVLGFKGVRADGSSVHEGKGKVYVDGVAHTGHIPYPVGSVARMDRAMVDDDPRSACSAGLHVGTLSHAQSFGSVMLAVRFSPTDVVSVPSHDNSKIRVCEFEVLSTVDRQTGDEPAPVELDDEHGTPGDPSAEDGLLGGAELDAPSDVNPCGEQPIADPDDPFTQRAADMAAWTAANDGAYPKRNGYGAKSDEESSLCLWAAKARKKYRKGKLTAEQIAAAEAIPGWAWTRSAHPAA
jgi:hypothetical protein